MGLYYLREARCKVCTSQLRDEVDQMLLGNSLHDDGSPYTYEHIAAWCAERGLQVSLGGLSRHKNGHLQPALQSALETERMVQAISQATGKKLSIHAAVANIIATKALRLLDEQDLSEVEIDKVLRVAMRAAEVGLKIERAEKVFSSDDVQKVEKNLAAKGISPETLKVIREELYGLTGG